MKFWDELFPEWELRDKIKNEYCINSKINLIRIRYNEKVIEKLDNLIKPLVVS